MNWNDRVKEFRRVPASELKANPKNWREHPPEQRKALGAVLDEVGIAGALLARETDDGLELIDGHLRTEMDDATEWPVLILDVDEDEADIILATSDPIGAMASQNDKGLTDLIASIKTDNAALGEMLDEMEKNIPTQIEEGETDADAVPEGDQVEKRCEPGDLWTLGRHRLLCGDSTKADDVARLMGGDTIGCVVSDPPYGMNYSGTARTAQSGMSNEQRRFVEPVIGDDSDFDPSFLLGWSDEVLLWGGDWYYNKLPPGGSWIVWDKRASVEADSIPGAPFEVCWSKRRQARTFIRVPWGGWVNKESSETERWHPTQKPIQVMASAIEAANGEPVVDPFSGSGTTLIACEQNSRTCYAMELDPHYCDVILQRWEDFSGLKAERA
jgi:DNA modification methylase